MYVDSFKNFKKSMFQHPLVPKFGLCDASALGVQLGQGLILSRNDFAVKTPEELGGPLRLLGAQSTLSLGKRRS